MFQFKTLNDDPDFLPVRSTKNAGAYDIRCSEHVILIPYEPQWVPTGLWIKDDPHSDKSLAPSTYENLLGHYLSEAEYDLVSGLRNCFFLRVYPRSSMFMKRIAYHPGIIDQDYRDEIRIGMCYQPIPWEEHLEPIILEPKSRIAQIQAHLFYPIVGGVEKESERQGGFGSTGA